MKVRESVTMETAAPGTHRRTVILDDDPTGSQEASAVPVLLRPDRHRLIELLRTNRSVFVLTNTRAVSEAESRALLISLRDDIAAARRALGVDILVVQRGDSTLRGHVFAEIDVFATPDSIVVFAPAFPAGGRQTVDGSQRILVDGRWLNAADTEFASDPVFGYSARTMVDFARERGARTAIPVAPETFFRTASAAPAGTVIVPDAETDLDLGLISDGILRLFEQGRQVIVRCAAPLAAYLAGAKSSGFVDYSALRQPGPVLVVAGSHTSASTRQLGELTKRWSAVVEIDAQAAIADPDAVAGDAARVLRKKLGEEDVVVLATERVRRKEHGTLDDGKKVMRALSSTVALVADLPGFLITKGGITAAEIVRTSLAADTAWVEGQVAPGISLWTIDQGRRRLPCLVVPGNMGEPDTLRRLVAKLVDR